MTPSTNNHRRGHTAFTLPELLVVIAVVCVLLAFFLPVLSRARDAARLAACANNMRRIGDGAHSYAADNQDRLPFPSDPSVLTNYAWGDVGSNWISDVFIQNYLGGWKIDKDDMGEPFETTRLACCPSMGRDGTQQWPYSNLIRNPNFSYAFNLYIAGGCVPGAPKGVPLSRVDAQTMLLMETCDGGRIGRSLDVNGAHGWHNLLTQPQYDRHYGGQHDGKVNVLFVDGNVRAIAVGDIPVMALGDPQSGSLESRAFWRNLLLPNVFSD